MRAVIVLAILMALCSGTLAWADDTAPPPPAPPTWAPPPVSVSQPVARPPLMPPPPSVMVAEEPRTLAPLPPPDSQVGDVCCFQKRDACGWPVTCDGCRYGRLEIVLEGIWSTMTSPDGRLGELAIGALAPQFDWDELDYEGEFGGRGAIRYAMAPQQWFEVRGAWYGEPSDSISRVGTFGFRPGLGGAGNPVTSVPVLGTMESEAEAWGVEVNYQGEMSCKGRLRTDLILGARYFRFEEESRVGFANAPIGQFAGPAFVQGEGTSQFAGLQVGGVAHFDLAQSFEVYGLAKFFGGWMRHEADVSDRSIFAGGLHSASDDEDDMQWGGELEVGLRWRLARWLSLQAGYNIFALAGVQRGYDTLDFSESSSGAVQARIETDEIIIHSVFAGITISF